MILVKSDRTNLKKCKVRKFKLKTDFEPEQVQLIDDLSIPANSLYKLCKERIETINKRLERCRLAERAIECAFNRNASILLESNSVPKQNGRVNARFIEFGDSDNGIFVQ